MPSCPAARPVPPAPEADPQQPPRLGERLANAPAAATATPTAAPAALGRQAAHAGEGASVDGAAVGGAAGNPSAPRGPFMVTITRDALAGDARASVAPPGERLQWWRGVPNVNVASNSRAGRGRWVKC
ncbi:MAG: hypothetical protein HY332_05770 [Chloroflexi bacterium]|nr:hypothetical protein [Chloroflexota bacterium]